MSDSMEQFMDSIYKRIGKAEAGPSRSDSPNQDGRARIMRRMEDPSCFGRITGKCGETMEVYLKVDGETIADASFITDGCSFSVACGYVATQLVRRRTMDEAVQIGGDTILMALEGVPEEETHCAYLAADALQAAIHRWMLGG